MVNINLAADSYENEKQSVNYGKGLIVLVAIMIILGGAYLWIYLAGKDAAAKIEAAGSQYDAEYKQLVENNKDIMDFQNRITVAKDLIGGKNSGYGSLPAIEASMVQGVYLKSLEFNQSKNAITADGVADNFDMMAKQILSFKQSAYFSGVATGTTSLDENGKVNFSLNLSIK